MPASDEQQPRDGAPPRSGVSAGKAISPIVQEVLIADGDELAREQVRRLVAARMPGASIRQSGSVAQAASQSRSAPPDVLLLGDEFGDGETADVLLRLTVARGTLLVPTVILAGARSGPQVARLLRLGAGDYLLKRALAEDSDEAAAALERAILHAREQHRLSRRAALYRANTLIKRRRERSALEEAEVARREAERARERLDLAVEGAELGTWDWYPATGRIVHNSRLATMLGYKPGELSFTYTLWRKLLHPEDAGPTVEALGRHLEGQADRYRLEHRLRTKDGQWKWVLVCGQVVARDELGRPTRVAGVQLDIDDRKRAELGLFEAKNHAEAAQQQLVDMVTSIRDAFLLLDRDWRFTFVNQRAEQLLGKSAAQLVGHVIWDIWPDLEDSPFAPALRRAMHQREMGEVTASFAPRRWLELRAYPAEEGAISLFCIDVTEQKHFEQQLQQARDTAEAARVSAERARETAERANRAKSEFLAVLSHELRTPLTPVLAGVQLLQKELEEAEAAAAAGDGNGELGDTLAMIRRNVELEVRLIDDLLDLTRITRGKMQLSKRSIDLNSSIRHVVEICRTELEEKGLELVLDLSADPAGVLADPARLQQVLWNLMKNAIKFTPAGGVVSVNSRYEARAGGVGGGFVVAEIADTGVGIDPALLQGIFNAFEQGGERVTRTFGGLGLGLAISRALIVAHGGTITAASQGRGQGASFTLQLPARRLASAVDRPQAHPEAPAAAGARVLLVEDHTDTARLMARFLERRMRVQVSCATTVEEGLAIFERASQTHGIDLIISDIGLPDGTGRDLLGRILEAAPQAPLPPAIALSGYGTEQDIKSSRDAGFREHITKPVDLDRLEQSVRRVLR